MMLRCLFALRPLQASFVACIAVAIMGCGGGSADTAGPPALPPAETVASVSVSPPTATLQVGTGATTLITATVTGSRGSTLTGQAVNWSSSDPTRASVSSSGLVSAVAAGSATITATVAGRSGDAAITVTPAPTFTVTIDQATVSVPLGLAAQVAATARTEAGAVLPGEPVVWMSSNPAVATVDANGLIVSAGAGTATISATARGFRGDASLTVTAAPPIAACKLPNRTSSVGFGFPRSTARLRTTGVVRGTVLFVDFPDAPASRTAQNVLDVIQPGAPAYYGALSYGAMTFQLEPNLRWFRMSKPSTDYGWPNNVTFQAHRALLQEAANLATSTTNMSQTDVLIVMTNPDAGGITFGPALVPLTGGGITVAGRATTIDNATNSGRDLLGWGSRWLSHEVGHLMSLPDLYDYAPPVAGALHLHVGEWSSMGLISARGSEWTAFERWQLGWLRDDQMACAPTGASLVSITPVESAGGLKAAVIPVSASLAVVVESRRALGFDSSLPQPGPLVYFVNTDVASGRGTMRVLPLDDADRVKLSRTLLVGQTVSYQNASVTLVSRTNGADVVRVVRP